MNDEQRLPTIEDYQDSEAPEEDHMPVAPIAEAIELRDLDRVRLGKGDILVVRPRGERSTEYMQNLSNNLQKWSKGSGVRSALFPHDLELFVIERAKKKKR